MHLFRSLMFVPGHRARMVERALGLGEFHPGPLDVAILDLEDGVPPEEKQHARSLIAEALGRKSEAGTGPARYVRVNAEPADWQADLAAIVRAGLDGVVAPKVEDAGALVALARALDESEREGGLARGAVRLVASIESARALLAAAAIAESSDRVVALLFGAEDFALDLGLPAEREGEAAELLYPRAAVVVAAAAAGRLAIDGIWPDIADAEGLRKDSLRGRRLGFAGKSLVHPGQIETINEVFSPSPAELAHAGRVIAASDEARRAGAGASSLDGRLVDPPIVARARRTLRTAEAVSQKKGTPPVERPAALEGKRRKR